MNGIQFLTLINRLVLEAERTIGSRVDTVLGDRLVLKEILEVRCAAMDLTFADVASVRRLVLKELMRRRTVRTVAADDPSLPLAA